MNLWQHLCLAILGERSIARLRHTAAAMTAFSGTFLSLSSAVCADEQIGDRWVATWGASPSFISQSTRLNNQSARHIALVTIGGRGQRLRIRLSNEFATEDVVVGAAHIALGGSNGSIQPSSDRILTFGGQQSVIIPSGAPVVNSMW